MDYVRGSSLHSLAIEQSGTTLAGTHRGEYLAGDLRGSVAGDAVHFRSSHKVQGTELGYHFKGRVEGDTMTGTVSLGEYGDAKWTAKRHKYSKSA
jgi:hypothetical protein